MAPRPVVDVPKLDATFRPLNPLAMEATMLTKLRRQSATDAVQARARWIAAVEAYAGPEATPVDPADVRGWAEDMNLEGDALDLFEHDAGCVERAARLEVGIALLNEQIANLLKPFKGDEAALTKAVAAAKAELARLEGLENDLRSYQITKGYERGDLAAARRSAPRLFPSET